MSNKRLRKCLSKVATLAILLAVLVACRPGVTGDHEFTGIRVQELESLTDRFFAREMRKGHIPGLALVVVQDGQVLLAKGYGYADLEGRVPIDPDRTVMRISSVSKLFVATAVMQIVERGELDLHVDVNRYLNTFHPTTAFQSRSPWPTS